MLVMLVLLDIYIDIKHEEKSSVFAESLKELCLSGNRPTLCEIIYLNGRHP